MNIKFIIPGKKKNTFIEEGISEYLKRLSKYCKVNLIYINEEKITAINEKSIKEAHDKEAVNILKQVANDYLVLIDIKGKELDSNEFKSNFENIISKFGNISFVFGSSYGISDILRNKANEKISLSKLTFTHYFSLLVLIEQVYRSFKMINNETYDK